MSSSVSFTSPPQAHFAERGRSHEDLTGANILVVDDNPTSRTLFSAQLQAGGYRNVDIVGDGTQALEAIRRRRPELIITDLLMPHMSGFELSRILRADRLTRNIPVLAHTASLDPEFRAKAFASGATDLFNKPYSAGELLCRVRILLERGRLVERLVEFQRLVADDLLQAAATQTALLPGEERLTQLRASYPLEVASHYEASVGLGGDIWGIEEAGEGRVLIFNADFAGHGVGAALNTVRLHSFIHSSAGEYDTPAALLSRLNRFLCGLLPTGQYATMFCAIADFRRNIVEYSSAASPPQLLRCRAGERFTVLQEPGFPLGVTRMATFDNHEAAFEPGGTLLLFSDAVIETPPPPDSVFDVEVLCEFVDGIPAEGGAHELCHRILRHLFSGIQAKPEDDLTLVAAHHLRQEDRP